MGSRVGRKHVHELCHQRRLAVRPIPARKAACHMHVRQGLVAQVDMPTAHADEARRERHTSSACLAGRSCTTQHRPLLSRIKGAAHGSIAPVRFHKKLAWQACIGHRLSATLVD